MQTLSWYFNRLGRMSAGEILWRACQFARRKVTPAARAQPMALRIPPVGAFDTRFIHVSEGLDVSAYERRVETIVNGGRYPVFDLPSCELGSPPNWNRDPLTGRQAPPIPAAALDYRDETLVGNIKYLWEPNRHLHLTQLAQAYALSGDERYVQEIERQLNSWLDQCPVGRGPNWTSSLELGIRLINWSLTWQWLGGEASPVFVGRRGAAFRERWLRSVHAHVNAIVSHYSRFSSANNHLIGEAAGVWIAAATWPRLGRLRTRGLQARKILEKQIQEQNAPDGGNREQALSYQQFVLDFFLLSGLAARASGRDFSRAYWERMEKMIEFLASMSDVAGHLPMIGDADDGYAVSLSPQEDFCPYRSLIATGAVLFGREDWAAKAGGLDDKTRWLTGAQPRADCAGARFEPTRAFPDSGYYLLGDRLETDDEIRLWVDAGPLGYLSLAAHGHADALAVVLNVGGHEVLVDPGTYAYHTEPEWRRYFRGTSAHNTVVVDGRDQSRQGGNFMWSRHANTRCLQFSQQPERQLFVGEHDGYTALADPVLHRRSIAYRSSSRTLEIEDVLECKEAHEVSLHWHFAPELVPLVDNYGIEVRADRHTVRLTPVERPQDIQVFKGGTAEQGGWISRSFGHKQPCTTVVWKTHIYGRARLTTRIDIRPSPRTKATTLT